MLVLTVREQQKLFIGDNIVIIVKKCKTKEKNKFVVVIDAPRELQVRRGEFKKKNNGKDYDEGFFVDNETN